MRKKILYTIDTLDFGGAEKSTIDIVTQLSGEFEPVVVTFYKKHTLQPLLTEKGIRVINVDLPGKFDFYKGVRRFKQICTEEKPDLVIATLFRSEIISRIVCRQLGIKNIGTFVSDTYSANALRQFSAVQLCKIRALQLLNRFTAKFCTAFISNALSIRESNAKALKVNKEKVAVIYRGRNISDFQPETNRKTPENFRFINVGRLRPGKGQADLINAFASFTRTFPNAQLHIAGEGPERTKLEQLIKDLHVEDNVKLLGNVSDVPALLNEYHVFVFPSHYEGFSGALIEAMLAGIPILSSDIAMNTEAVEHLHTGYIFKVKDISSIKHALEFSVKNYEAMLSMGRNAQKIARGLYDLKSIVRQHETVYRNCMNTAALYSPKLTSV